VTLRPAAQPEAVKDQMVSQKDYEALLALYQARNSIQIAKAEGVDIYAHDTLQRAEALTQQAQKIWDGKVNRERVVMLARQATQTAEDARNIAAKKSGTQMSTASSSRP